MVLDKPPVDRHDTRVVTERFLVSGKLEVLGPVLNYINDSTRKSLPLYDASVASLVPDSPLKAFSQSQIVLLKSQIFLIYFSEEETRASIRPIENRELLVAYTPIAICRGYFHMSAEASVDDFLDVTPGDLLPMTEVQIFPTVEFPAPFPTKAELLLISPDHIQLYHPE